ncbi:MAG: hypothetical protein V1748_03380 [Actinomycetota bacterium]
MAKVNAIFLGAGASAPEGAPLQGDLFKEYFKYHREHPVESRRAMDERLATVFRDFFGIDVESDDLEAVEFPTFEETLTMFDLATIKLESFRGCGADPISYILQADLDLVFLIAVILDHKLEGECRYHASLVHKLVEQEQLRRTFFIDMNYDILADNALMRLWPEYVIDYGVELANMVDPGDSVPVRLFKLHGSLNWLYCPTCIELTLTPGEGKVAGLVFEPQVCAKCGTGIFPFMVPPSYFKLNYNLFLGNIWKRAEDELMEADRYVFCGYSFPDADIYLKYLLKRVEMNRGATPDVIVINDFEGKTQAQRDVEISRYRRFFKDSSKVDFRIQTFEEFCAEGLP